MSTSNPTPDEPVEDIKAEYQLDYRQAKPNRFAPTPLVIQLDPDVAQVFTSAEAVNAVLRALIQTMPPSSTLSK